MTRTALTQAEGAQAKPLTPVQKAAVVMMLFGEDVAAEVLRALGPREVKELGRVMYALGPVSHRAVEEVLDEFFGILREQTGIGAGSGPFVRHVLTDALGSYKAQSVMSRIAPAEAERPIEILDWMDATAIAELVHDEHPQIIALVVAAIDPAQAAEVLKLLPEDLQPEIIRRIATLNTVEPDALRDLEDVMQRKFKANTTLRASQIGGVKSAARILNFSRQAEEQRILRDIRKEDKDLMEDLQDNMFVFDNLVKSDDRSLQTLLRAVETEELVLALKGADPAVRQRLLACMSSRAATNIIDEMEALGPVKLSSVQEAQKAIIATARRMADEGTITLAGRGGEEMI